MPLLSIIIPTLNSEKYIKRCIDSITSQTFKGLEIIIQDGGSTDNTQDILSRIKNSNAGCDMSVYAEKDFGIYDAMNKAIPKAKGDWLIFLGSDDRLFNNTIVEEVFSDDELDHFDVLYGNVYSERFNGKYDGLFSAKKLLSQNLCHQSIFFNKRVFDIVGNFSLKYNMHADWHHNIRWFFNKQIRHRYLDLIISDYADGGLSSILGDQAFYEDKLKLYLKHAYSSIDSSLKKEILNQLILAPHVPRIKKLSYKFLFHLNNF